MGTRRFAAPSANGDPAVRGADRFFSCLDQVLRLEGGFVDDPRDPGGATNRGVTLATLSRAWGRPAGLEELKALTADQAAPIYRKFYWEPAGCAALAPGLDRLVFDTAVNMGVAQARHLLDLAGLVRGAAEAVCAVSAARRARYRALKGFDVFGKGWLRRLDAVTATALAEAAGTSDGEAA